MTIDLPAGLATGLGALPDADPEWAAACALDATRGLPAAPTLPQRSPHEGLFGQAANGIQGVTVQRDGSLCIDQRRFDPEAPVPTEFDGDAFVSWRAFVQQLETREAPPAIKWQITGPLTLGMGLLGAGAPRVAAFRAAGAAASQRVRAVSRWFASALPGVVQIGVLDEPVASGIRHPGFPLETDEAVAVLAAVLCAGDPDVLWGLHCGGSADWSLLLEAGPSVVSLPARDTAISHAGSLGEFVESGGYVMWGAVPTGEPLGNGTERFRQRLSSIWRALAMRGADRSRLRDRAIITPQGGLAHHGRIQARAVLELACELASSIADPIGGASAPRLV